ncbi:TPA: hypothetical protein HA225_03315 [Candidatus Micrarchaeota archaeon]|nr:hypothetical protein [Candidatus Micrarchaeota archaeon]HIH30259.1 hypothetical protein [Candidatus Micrarchaeota archaeon]
MKEKPKPKRDWKKYEAELDRRAAKRANFLLRRPTKVQLGKELAKMNRGKKGRVFEIPESVIGFSMFIKTSFDMTDRDMAKFLKGIFGKDIPVKELDHPSIVKRRQYLKFEVPFDISNEKLEGKTIYFDGTCMRLGRGGNYRSKKYGTEVKYLRIGVFTNDKCRVIDFTIGDEHDPEVEMIREKLPQIQASGAAAFNSDGIGSAKDIVVGLTKAGITPIIRASAAVVKSKRNAPPPELCVRRKKEDEIIWEDYAKAQADYQKWRKETGYSMRWVFSEGRFSALKRMHGEEVLCRTQKAIHDEICTRLMLLEGELPQFWA